MEITSKGRYAVRIMADLARNGSGFVSLNDISKRQGISIKYLEKIISMMAKANLVESMRGALGGYKLAKNPENCTIKEILDATGDSIKIATCIHGEKCPKAETCDTIGVWNSLNDLINKYLTSVTLKDLVDKTCQNKI